MGILILIKWEYCSVNILNVWASGVRTEKMKIETCYFASGEVEVLEMLSKNLFPIYFKAIADLGLEGWEGYAVNEGAHYFKRPIDD
jgi:hypothetical protein